MSSQCCWWLSRASATGGRFVAMSGRPQPNLTRTLAKMESAGFITMKAIGRRKAPSVAFKKIVVEIDPYSDRDRLNVV